MPKLNKKQVLISDYNGKLFNSEDAPRLGCSYSRPLDTYIGTNTKFGFVFRAWSDLLTIRFCEIIDPGSSHLSKDSLLVTLGTTKQEAEHKDNQEILSEIEKIRKQANKQIDVLIRQLMV